MRFRDAVVASALVAASCGIAHAAGTVKFKHTYNSGDGRVDTFIATALLLGDVQYAQELTGNMIPNAPDDYEAKSVSTVHKPMASGGGGPTTVLQTHIQTGLIAPNNQYVENDVEIVVPITLTNPTASPISTMLTINAGLNAMGTFPGSGTIGHGGSAALFDHEPVGMDFLGPANYWGESFSPMLDSPFPGLIDTLDLSFPSPGRWAETGNGSVSYDVMLAPGETINRWLRFTTYIDISNMSDAGPALYDAVTDPGMFTYDVVLGDGDVAFDVVPAPATLALIPLAGGVALRRRRQRSLA